MPLINNGRVNSCSRMGLRAEAKGGEGTARLRVGSWNIECLIGKSIELVKILKKKKIYMCVQKIRWVNINARVVDEFKLCMVLWMFDE